MKGATGQIIILAFPDTFVRMSDEWICKLLPYFGLGYKGYIKAGHAAMILVDNRSGELHYFDFGRYITPKGKGRVRSAYTDAELHIPLQAVWDADHRISNLHDILLWLEAHPEKTHGKGRILASVCEDVDFDSAMVCAQSLQEGGSIPYGAFNEGSNCARFVAEVLIQAANSLQVRKSVQRLKRFTPSTVGNVEKGSSSGLIWEVHHGKIKRYTGSALRENLVNYFYRIPLLPDSDRKEEDLPVNLHFLGGIGSHAYFEIVPMHLPEHHVRIKRYNQDYTVDYDGVYYSKKFCSKSPFEFTYDSNCAHCHVIQNGKTVRLESVASYASFNSWQKERPA